MIRGSALLPRGNGRLLTVAAFAAACAPSFARAECVPGEPVTDSAEYAVAAAAAARYMQLTSAATYAERVLLPPLVQGAMKKPASGPWMGGVLGERLNVLWGVGKVPIGVATDGGCKVGRAPFDLYSGNLGLGLSVGPAYAFYATSMGLASAGDTPNRIISPFAVPTVGAIYSLAGPALGASSKTAFGAIYSLDAIIGGGVATPWVSGSAGYAASKGFFGRVTQPDLHLFLTSAIRSTAELAYLRTGAELLKVTKDQITATTGYFRQVAQVPAIRPGAGAGFPSDADAKALLFRTIHLEQVDIARLVDVVGAYGLGSFDNLHELSVRLHTPGFTPQPETAGGNARPPAPGASLTVGMVRVPERRLLGQSGKPLPHIALQVATLSPRSPSRFAMSVRFNDPEILTLYPAAGGSVNLTLEGGFGR